MPQSTWSQETYLRAFLFAANAHQGQLVPGTDIAYILHLSIVSMEVLAALQNEFEPAADLAVQCAILHDVIEDTDVAYGRVVETFGTEVAEGVKALTKDAMLEKSLRMADSLQRIRQQPKAVWKVKLADRICNLQPPPSHWPSEKRARYREEAREILAALGEASPFLAARLAAKIEAYQTYL